MHKNIFIQNIPLNALVDTGSNAKLFYCSAYTKLGSPNLHPYAVLLIAFGDSRITLLVYFTVSITINNDEFITSACVLALVQFTMSTDVILNKDILKQGEIHINKDCVLIQYIFLYSYINIVSE